eukprot:177973_1
MTFTPERDKILLITVGEVNHKLVHIRDVIDGEHEMDVIIAEHPSFGLYRTVTLPVSSSRKRKRAEVFDDSDEEIGTRLFKAIKRVASNTVETVRNGLGNIVGLSRSDSSDNPSELLYYMTENSKDSSMDDQKHDGIVTFKIDRCFLSKHRRNPVRGFAWHPSRFEWAVGTESGDVRVYDLKGSRWTSLVLGHPRQYGINSLQWSPSCGSILAVACETGICVWKFSLFDVYAGTSRLSESSLYSHSSSSYNRNATMKLFRFDGHNSVDGAIFSPCGRYLASWSSTSSTFVIWNLSKGPTGYTAMHVSSYIRQLGWSPNGDSLFCAMENTYYFRIYDVSTWSYKNISFRNRSSIQSLCWGPCSNILYVALKKSRDVYQVTLGSPDERVAINMDSFSGLESPGGYIHQICLSPTGHRLAISFEPDYDYPQLPSNRGTELIALFSSSENRFFSSTENNFTLIGFIRGPLFQDLNVCPDPSTEVVNLPTHISFHPEHASCSLLMTAWQSGELNTLPLVFPTDNIDDSSGNMSLC